MSASSAQQRANRQNARKSTGPKTEDGKARSRANAVRHGLTGDGIVQTEDVRRKSEAIRSDLNAQFRPKTETDQALVDQAALAMARLNLSFHQQLQSVENTATRARTSWDSDRSIDATRLANRLSQSPLKIKEQLKATTQGCRVLIERWAGLYQAAKADGWTDDQRQLAADLLGIHPALRDSDPRVAAHQPAEKQAKLARKQISKLKRLQAEQLDVIDQFEQERTIAGDSLFDGPTARRFQRYEHQCFQRMTWALKELHRRGLGNASSSENTDNPHKREIDQDFPLSPDMPRHHRSPSVKDRDDLFSKADNDLAIHGDAGLSQIMPLEKAERCLERTEPCRSAPSSVTDKTNPSAGTVEEPSTCALQPTRRFDRSPASGSAEANGSTGSDDRPPRRPSVATRSSPTPPTAPIRRDDVTDFKTSNSSPISPADRQIAREVERQAKEKRKRKQAKQNRKRNAQTRRR